MTCNNTNIRMIPNFFIAGCQKCATTSLHNYLIQHPDIYLPKQKETKHFVMDDRYQKGFTYYQRTFFNTVKNETAIGEVDPDYIYFNEALKKIKIHFNIETLKFIFIFRNPVERAFSHYLMTYRRGIEVKSFNEAIACEKQRIAKDFFSRMHFSYTDRGFYYKQLRPFMSVLKPEQILFLLMDDLKKDRNQTLSSCFNFLGVDENLNKIHIKTDEVHHSAKIPRSEFLLNEIVRKQDTWPKQIFRFLIPNEKMRHGLRQKILDLNQTSRNKKMEITLEEKSILTDMYKEENKKLGQLIGRDLSHWDEQNIF